VRLNEQVQPDKIKLLTRRKSPRSAAKVAALADVCIEWGPFGETERPRALSDLEPLAVGKLTTQKRVDASGLWSATLAPFANRPAAERRVSELRAQGVRDVSIVDAGSGRFTVAIGLFRNEDAARVHAAELTRQGVIGTATATARSQPVSLTLIVVRDPPANVVARLRELQPNYPSAELKVTGAIVRDADPVEARGAGSPRRGACSASSRWSSCRSAGGVASALETLSGRIYRHLPRPRVRHRLCAEHAAVRHAEARETGIRARRDRRRGVLARERCRELIVQLDRRNLECEVILPGDTSMRMADLCRAPGSSRCSRAIEPRPSASPR
jgi:hypothetical protein